MRLPALFLAFCLGFLKPVLLAGDLNTNAEIEFLLRFLQASDCRFIRSGKEYPPHEAAEHLRMKLGKAGARVKTADKFISGIASKSYLTGKPYLVRLPNGTTQPAETWLTKALEKQRAAQP
jgi:hypothetical protein